MAKPHIMLVDDEEVLLRLTKRGLERLGYHITTFNQAEDALKNFIECPGSFDLIITDKSMPLLNGFDFLCEIKKMSKDIPLILLTGFIDEEQEISLKENVEGIKIILKPIRMNHLAEHIVSSLSDKKEKFNHE
jgi:DNA-binding NtrC family response regulator